jgi:hypothetical protein
MAFPSESSLYQILLGNQELKSLLEQKIHAADNKKVDKFYSSLEVNELKNGALCDVIFANTNDAARTKILGDINKEGFLSHLNDCRKTVKKNLMLEVLAYKSFPETYFHPDVASALAASKYLTNSSLVKPRVQQTGLYVLSAMSKEHGMAYGLAIGMAHLIRRADYHSQKLYTAEGVEFTLLTFSYFGAKASGVKEDSWFFFWKVFGSLMGLSTKNLHNNFGEAEARMKAIHALYDGKKLAKEQEDLLDAFITGMYTLSDIEKKPEMVSKRMRAYLKEKGQLK